MKYISIIGSTGSIGTQTLDIAASHKDSLKVVALAAGKKNLPLLLQQVNDFQPELVCLPDAQSAGEVKEWASTRAPRAEIVYGEEGLIAVAQHSTSDILVTAVVGFLGLKPTLKAIEKGKTIALANKETMVAAGHLVNALAREKKAAIVPVDSEHSAIFQSLEASLLKGRAREEIHQLILTGSGGPFRQWSQDQLKNATINDALKHPNWSMGAKITIDSATLMNKGLEVIEARWLFDVKPEQIKVVIHPQSILHSAVEFQDGSIVGQLGLPDMRLPIHYALFYPQREYSSRVPRLDLTTLKTLTFEEPDLKRFPCLRLAQEIVKEDDSRACVLNGANEIVVAAFLNGEISFTEISSTLERVLEAHTSIKTPSFEEILHCDRWARQEALKQIKKPQEVRS